MGKLLCENNLRDVWCRNESVRAEIGQILHTHTHTRVSFSSIDVDHTSFNFGLCGRNFVLCLFGHCPGLCTICHSCQHTGVVHGKVAFEDIPAFGVCRPACHDSSLYLFVLVLFREAVVLFQIHVASDIFYQHIVHVYWGVVYNHQLCLCDVHNY